MHGRLLVILVAVFSVVGCARRGGGAGIAYAGVGGARAEHAWAKSVVLETEYGASVGRVTRWAHSPTMSLFGASQEHRAVTQHVVAHINRVLTGSGVQILIAPEGDTDANIEVHFAPVARFSSIAEENGFTYVRGNDGFFWMFWYDNYALRKTYVLLATDQLFGPQLYHFAFEEITQSLGLANDSGMYPDSIFYSRGGDGGEATRPSALDDRLLRFTYTALRPGDGSSAFDAAFRASWQLSSGAASSERAAAR
jgi:hypothetical protein